MLPERCDAGCSVDVGDVALSLPLPLDSEDFVPPAPPRVTPELDSVFPEPLNVPDEEEGGASPDADVPVADELGSDALSESPFLT
jgi:hypothetical protein